MIWVNSVFLTLNCLFCLSKMLAISHFVNKLFGPIFGLVDPLYVLFLPSSLPPLPPSSPSSGCEIEQVCQFVHGLFRSLGHLPGGLTRFIPCQPRAHFTRLIPLGWWQCGRGLTWPQSREMPVIQAILDFFGYPVGAALKLFSGTLKLRYSSTSPLPGVFPLGPSSVSPGRPQRLVPALLPGFTWLRRFGFWYFQRPCDGKDWSFQDLENRGMRWMLHPTFFRVWGFVDFGKALPPPHLPLPVMDTF